MIRNDIEAKDAQKPKKGIVIPIWLFGIVNTIAKYAFKHLWLFWGEVIDRPSGSMVEH